MELTHRARYPTEDGLVGRGSLKVANIDCRQGRCMIEEETKVREQEIQRIAIQEHFSEIENIYNYVRQ